MAKEKKETQKNDKQDAAGYWNELLKKEFLKETDRGAVILAGTLLDIGLDSLLRSYLVPVASSTDELFDGNNSPLGTFSAKINMSFRLGLVSQKYARDLNLIRRIRNEFAHNIHGCDFEHSSVKARVIELLKSFAVSKNLKEEERSKMFPEGTRGDFLMIASWMLYALHGKIKDIKHIEACDEEWGYLDKKIDLENSTNKG